MTRNTWQALLPVALAWLLGGCASVPRDAGVGEVSRIVEERTGQRLAWQPGMPVVAPDDAELEARLQGELTVDQAVALALERNRDLLAALEELGLARADLIAARTVRNPLIDGEYHFPGEEFASYEFAITAFLVDLLQLKSRRALGAAKFESTRLRLTASVVGFAGEVRVDYFTLQGAQASLAQQQAIVAAAEAATLLAQRQHDAGNITDLELESEQARYEQAKLALARAQLDEIEARERLLADLGAMEPIALRLPPLAAPPETAERSAEEVEASQDTRLDLQLARAEVEAARKAAPIARAAPLDELAVGVHFDREAGGERSRGPAATIPIPLFDQGLAQRSRATARLRMAEQRLHAVTVTGRSRARAARERLAEARARAEYVSSVVVPRQQRILSLTQLEYNAMLRGAFDVLRARQQLADAERERVLAQRDYWIARTELESAISGVAGFSVRAEMPRLAAGERPSSGGASRAQEQH